MKRDQSVEERKPLVDPFACERESVLPLKRRGPEIVAAVMAPVPFPVRSPPKVVEPVPPKEVETVVVAMTEPVLLVKRRLLVIFEIAKLVEVACWSDELPLTVRPGVESAPVLLIVVVPVCPKDALFERWFVVKKLVVVAEVAVALVVVSPPLKLRSVVVALLGNK